MTIYELSEAYSTLQALLEDPDADQEVVKDTLEGKVSWKKRQTVMSGS